MQGSKRNVKAYSSNRVPGVTDRAMLLALLLALLLQYFSLLHT